MQAIDRELLSVLSDSTVRFVVPVYQRSYAWKEEHWSCLWKDILAIAKEQDKEHFTGSIVWVGRMQGPSTNSDGNILVDGQQRLTTLSLIILAYAEYAKNHNDKAKNGNDLPVTFAEIIGSGYLYWNFKKGEQRYKLTLSDVDKSTFKALLDSLESPFTPIPATGSSLTNAYEYFRTKIAGLEDQSVLWKGLQRLRIVNVTLDPYKDNPQLVFESMNSTGKPLCHADLIRNYILLGLPIDQQTELYHNFWRQIELTLDTDKNEEIFDKFIFHYLTLYTAPNIVNEKELYQTFKNFRNSCSKPLEDLLLELLTYARIYACITMKGIEKNPDIASILRDIVILQATPVIPLIMLFYRQWLLSPEQISREEFITTLKYIETYLVYRTLCDYRSNVYNRYIPKLINKYQENFSLGEFSIAKPLLATLELERGTTREFPTPLQVKRTLETKNFYGMAPFRKKFFFEKLENSLHPKNIMNIFDGTYTIEHIMPQTINPKTDWAKMLGEGYEKTYEQYLHLLGNLTITAYNSELSNYSFAQKKEAYLDSEPVALTKDILKEETWTYDQIILRTRKLAERLVTLWERPAISQEEATRYSLLKKDKENISTYISLKELLQSGVLQVNEKLTSLQNSIYKNAECFLNETGLLEFSDGHTDEYPTSAAKYVMQLQGKPVKDINGWTFWFIPRLGCRLAEAKEFLDYKK